MITPMLRPELFGALATHAGDALYELCYIPEFGDCVRALRDYDGDVARWWDDFRSRVAFTKKADELPCSASTAWPRAFPPRQTEHRCCRSTRAPAWSASRCGSAGWTGIRCRMVPGARDALRSLRGIWIDAGKADDYYLDIGAEAFRAALAEAGVPDEVIRFELFDGTHSSIDYRYPLALAWLCERIAG